MTHSLRHHLTYSICLMLFTAAHFSYASPAESFPIEFKGFVSLSDKTRFSFKEVVSGRSKWVSVGESAFGLKLEAFNDETMSITGSYMGERVNLKIATASAFRTPETEKASEIARVLAISLSKDPIHKSLPVMQEPYLSLYQTAEPEIIVDLVRRGYPVPQSKVHLAINKVKNIDKANSSDRHKPQRKKRKSVLPRVDTSFTVESKIERNIVGYGKN